jgi:hypothetical protein
MVIPTIFAEVKGLLKITAPIMMTKTLLDTSQTLNATEFKYPTNTKLNAYSKWKDNDAKHTTRNGQLSTPEVISVKALLKVPRESFLGAIKAVTPERITTSVNRVFQIVKPMNAFGPEYPLLARISFMVMFIIVWLTALVNAHWSPNNENSTAELPELLQANATPPQMGIKDK